MRSILLFVIIALSTLVSTTQAQATNSTTISTTTNSTTVVCNVLCPQQTVCPAGETWYKTPGTCCAICQSIKVCECLLPPPLNCPYGQKFYRDTTKCCDPGSCVPDGQPNIYSSASATHQAAALGSVVIAAAALF